MTFADIIQGTEKPDVLEYDSHSVTLRITDIDTLVELIDGKPSWFTAGGIVVKLCVL
jgi:hypothetical protein